MNELERGKNLNKLLGAYWNFAKTYLCVSDRSDRFWSSFVHNVNTFYEVRPSEFCKELLQALANKLSVTTEAEDVSKGSRNYQIMVDFWTILKAFYGKAPTREFWKAFDVQTRQFCAKYQNDIFCTGLATSLKNLFSRMQVSQAA